MASSDSAIGVNRMSSRAQKLTSDDVPACRGVSAPPSWTSGTRLSPYRLPALCSTNSWMTVRPGQAGQHEHGDRGDRLI